MKINRLFCCLINIVLLSLSLYGGDIKVIPYPVKATLGNGSFELLEGIPLIIEAPDSLKNRIKEFATEVLKGVKLGTRSSETNNNRLPKVELVLSDSLNYINNYEGYSLQTTSKGAKINATSPEGLFYGLMTLQQLVDENNNVPEIEIIDFPRFEYRGVMIDISRHFRDKEFIKKQLDAMARLKMNRLHLHLTDAAGWRIEIEKYPELTEFAAWRPQETWKEWNDAGNNYINGSDPFAHGGYLSKEDAKEIVEYAAKRFITVIPEIELPSHSEEVTSTFPQLSCSHARQPDVCVGNEETFEFFNNVLDEIIEIFPSEYIHIGGDEASKQAWKLCELCLERMKNENISNVDELQQYMIHRIEKYLASKGRKIIGWDEIMEGTLEPNAMIMSWRGTEGGIEAARRGHEVIMTPGAYCYLDSYQDAPATQPEAISGYLPLEKVYSYNPVPDSLINAIGPFIKGIQGNLWTEYIPTAQHAEYMLYPRTLAIAEIGWTPQENREWPHFYSRAKEYNDFLQRTGYHVFDLKGEVGNRREAKMPAQHLALGKSVKYNVPWWNRYNASFEKTLTDGERGSWTYGDGKWQGFLYKGDERLDVTIDLEKIENLHYIGADFMQITGPGVWLPAEVIISISDDGVDFIELTRIEHTQKNTAGLSFKNYSWVGDAKGRYVRYVAKSTEGVLFSDEIIIK